jgi:hypothetical protein
LLLAGVLVMGVVASAKTNQQVVTLTGTVTCSRCLGIQPHKGYTNWSWALHSVSQGDDIVLVTRDKTYKLDGSRDELSRYLADKASVTGTLHEDTLEVTGVSSPRKSG